MVMDEVMKLIHSAAVASASEKAVGSPASQSN
jgi:hypothetical protein